MENTTTKEELQKTEKAWMKETGRLDFPLTNDYMFRALLQKNEKDWPERSLSYLCREFDNLEKGEGYSEVMPAVHIGILNYDLFEDAKEFYSTNYMMNVKNHKIYSDKLCIHVLSLNQINMATEEDKTYGIDYWARLFRASSWKELKDMVMENSITEDAAETIYEIYNDKIIRDQIFAREEYNMRERRNKRVRAEYSEALKVIDAQKGEIAKLTLEIKQLKEQLQNKKD